jgi:hypothetical protein
MPMNGLITFGFGGIGEGQIVITEYDDVNNTKISKFNARK